MIPELGQLCLVIALCLALVQAVLPMIGAQTGNSVRVLRSETSEANNFVVVGVGPNNAPWNCLVNSGVALEVYSATDEGAL